MWGLGLGTLFQKGLAHGVFFGVGVGSVGRYDVANPAERAARANPEAGREDEPENARQDATVIKLADAGNDKAQSSC